MQAVPKIHHWARKGVEALAYKPPRVGESGYRVCAREEDGGGQRRDPGEQKRVEAVMLWDWVAVTGCCTRHAVYLNTRSRDGFEKCFDGMQYLNYDHAV